MSQKITVNGISFQVEPGRNTAFWDNVNQGVWEPETFEIFDRCLSPETLMLDIGAWIGPTSLYGVQRAKECIAFEPDPVAFEALEKNVAANKKSKWAGALTVKNAGINKDGASFELGGRRDGGDSQSSALFPNRRTTWMVKAHRLQDVLAEHADQGQPVFLKIDIEGGEYELLPAISEILVDPGITAYISFHPKFLRQAMQQGQDAAFDWQTPFIAAHEIVLDALPWDRTLTFGKNERVSRESLTDALRDKQTFPTELLVM